MHRYIDRSALRTGTSTAPPARATRQAKGTPWVVSTQSPLQKGAEQGDTCRRLSPCLSLRLLLFPCVKLSALSREPAVARIEVLSDRAGEAASKQLPCSADCAYMSPDNFSPFSAHCERIWRTTAWGNVQSDQHAPAGYRLLGLASVHRCYWGASAVQLQAGILGTFGLSQDAVRPSCFIDFQSAIKRQMNAGYC